MLTGGPPPEQVHLQFGADAASQIAVSWAAATAVARPRLRFSQASGGPIGEVHASERGYTDALTGETVYTYHAKIDSLDPGTCYGYEVVHDGAPPARGTFRTGPRGRSGRFRFTSVGDQSIPAPVGLGLGPNSPNAGFVVDAIEALDPLFHLANGDLCYGNSTDQPVATWTSYFANITRSASFRPWMPALGNHENETGNGQQGFASYLTRFELPGNGTPEFAGNWYAFTVGSVLIVSLSNDDVCLQDAGFSSYRRDHVPGYDASGADPYIRGYSRGLQERWLARVLGAASQSEEIDWIVVCMHQVAMSSAHFNGADLGIRQHWLPLFDAFGVDLVLAGHEHHFERTFPVRGTLDGSDLLTPAPRGTDSGEMDTSRGTVHLTIGGGGHPYNSPGRRLHGPGEGVVITEVGDGDPHRQRQPTKAAEPAPWSAYHDDRPAFGFASFSAASQPDNGQMIYVDPERFEYLVASALDSLPEQLGAMMRNVAVTVEHNPGPRGLLGLYQGVPLTSRTSNYAGVLPDHITIYRQAICAICWSEAEVAEQVRKTVVHEVGHHFGISDERLEELGW